ncbi:MAG: helix-turn-helix domain-containing protein [Thermoplasmata archaeon]|nr:helix-turn-helix domain-containing protein [Thermoplasmata archaeon]
MEEDLLALSRRRTIYEHILAHPGTYIREMESALELSMGDLQYHLRQLEKGGLVTTHDDGHRKNYFVAEQVKLIDRHVLSTMKLKTPRRIIIFLMFNPDSSFKEILAQFSFTKGALSYQLKRLLKSGMIVKGKMERESIYKVTDEDHMSQVLMTYRSGIMDEALDNFIDTWTKIG